MPTYVYKFVDTGETIEIQQKFDDATLTEAVHPTTGETLPVKKVFLPVGITFKGDGFYKTDSRSSKGTTTSSSSSSESASSPSSSDSTTGSAGSGAGSSSDSGSSSSSSAGSSD